MYNQEELEGMWGRELMVFLDEFCPDDVLPQSLTDQTAEACHPSDTTCHPAVENGSPLGFETDSSSPEQPCSDVTTSVVTVGSSRRCQATTCNGKQCKRYRPCALHQPLQESNTKRKHTRWSVEEHLNFLEGLTRYGNGKWIQISQFIKTKSPTQIKAHAYRFFKRKVSVKKNSSIHDLDLISTNSKENLKETKQMRAFSNNPQRPSSSSCLIYPLKSEREQSLSPEETSYWMDVILNL